MIELTEFELWLLGACWFVLGFMVMPALRKVPEFFRVIGTLAMIFLLALTQLLQRLLSTLETVSHHQDQTDATPSHSTDEIPSQQEPQPHL